MALQNPLNTNDLFNDCIPLMVTAVAIPVVASNVYQSSRVAYVYNSNPHKIILVSGVILALYTLISMIDLLSGIIGCDKLFGTFQITWYCSSLLIDGIVYLRVYRPGLLSKIIAVLMLVCQVARLFFLVRTIMQAQLSINQLDICKGTVSRSNAIGTAGTEALCTLFLFAMIVKEIHHRRTKENFDWLTTVIEDGIVCSVGIVLTQLVLTVVAFFNRWPLEFSAFQYISWLLTSKLLIEQLEIYHGSRVRDKSLTANCIATTSLSHSSRSGTGKPFDEQSSSLQRGSSDKSRLVHPNLTAPWVDTYDKDAAVHEITLHTRSSFS
ncbi:hypothetical protein K493DRAFT_308332 [Basidiobolus meristosporus CBS 931.73]|uniref:Integral membrane protein n=1 Tax=Basidiobolus meristosporus CBS 931.73 TaxID=1314790 RepID=A0A1Y1X534_9FUNG|nr:hypothetical protein K493DRAFT_308332 [Basidiobolus meristosporus CBS 931.73]|eukprot:ORX80466.1 hypothetical protein K493DRAFT_308332 [Basidiobolus meristosporus CBS 931.73]